jgi:cytochrome c-type biogenesis protein
MGERIAARVPAGLISIAFPCVLPLVPGYLSAISAVEVDRLGERGIARRVVVASMPFALGFTVVFVVLGAGAAASAAARRPETQDEDRRLRARRARPRLHRAAAVAERMWRPGACTRAAPSGSRVLLGARSRSARRRAWGSCSRRSWRSPRDSRTVVRGSLLLARTRSGSRSRSSLIGSPSRTR